MRASRAALVTAALAATGAAGAQTREEVARRYAPTIYQETQSSRPRRDFISTFDYDCDWNGDNNRQNLDRARLPARVYYAVYETATHWFVHYLAYHATDDKLTNGHEHDTESVLVVVRRGGTPLGALEAMETRFHTVWYQYAVEGAGVRDAGDNVDGPVHFDGASGRPAVYQQASGHGICGGFAPPCITGDYCDLAILCLHNERPHFNRRGVRYRYDPEAAAREPEPRAPGPSDEVDAAYDLVPIESTLWARRAEIGRGRVYASAEDYAGSRCRTPDAGLLCPRGYGGDFQGDDGDPPGAMWAQEGGRPSLPRGEVFFDPAYAMSRRLAFRAPFSLEYTHNPYVGVGALAPMRAGTVCDAPPADAGAPDAGAPDVAAMDAAAADAEADAAVADVADVASAPDVSVDAGGPAGDAAMDVAMADGGARADEAGGCGCHATRGAKGVGGAWALALAALLGRRRAVRVTGRRRAPPRTPPRT